MTRAEKIRLLKSMAAGLGMVLQRNVVWIQNPHFDWEKLSEVETAAVFQEYDQATWDGLTNMQKIEKCLTGPEIVFLDKTMDERPEWRGRLNEIKTR